jgi:hypothetical protein
MEAKVEFVISGNLRLDVVLLLPHINAGSRGKIKVEGGKAVHKEEKGVIMLAIVLDDGTEVWSALETVRLLNPVFREITLAMWEKKE